MSGSVACTVRGADHVLVYLNRHEHVDVPAARFMILECANLVNGAQVDYVRRFPPQMCITSGAYSETSRVFFVTGYRIDTGAVQVVVLAADAAPNAPAALFSVDVAPFAVSPVNLDRMVWIVDPVPAPLGQEEGGLAGGRVALDIIIERCPEEPTKLGPRVYTVTEHRLVFENINAMSPGGSLSVPAVPRGGAIVVSTGLTQCRVFNERHHSTMTHWTTKFFDNNLGMVQNLPCGRMYDTFLGEFVGDIYVPSQFPKTQLAGEYVRTQSRLKPKCPMSDTMRGIRIMDRRTIVGRRVIEVDAHTDKDTGRYDGHVSLSAFYEPTRDKFSFMRQHEQKQKRRLEMKKSTIITGLVWCENVSPGDDDENSAHTTTNVHRGLAVQWLTDEWVLVEDYNYKLRVYFLPDPVCNTAAFLGATVSSPNSLLQGLSPDVLLGIVDEVARVQESGFAFVTS